MELVDIIDDILEDIEVTCGRVEGSGREDDWEVENDCIVEDCKVEDCKVEDVAVNNKSVLSTSIHL